MNDKTHEELIEEFLANGGKIEVIPPVEPNLTQTVNSTSKKIPELKTLHEAELLYGKKQVKKKRIKKPDYSNINMNLIPDHLKKMLNIDSDNSGSTKEEDVEANKNFGSDEAGV